MFEKRKGEKKERKKNVHSLNGGKRETKTKVLLWCGPFKMKNTMMRESMNGKQQLSSNNIRSLTTKKERKKDVDVLWLMKKFEMKCQLFWFFRNTEGRKEVFERRLRQ